MIDQATINRVIEAADIVDVVKEFVTLRKSGTNYKGLCPFHNEKTPSFTVSPSKQVCKCFSCGKGGNVIHFIMEHEQMSYPEAIKWLGKKYGIEVHDKELSDEEKQSASVRESMFVLNEWAKDFFTDTLRNHVDGIAIGMAYFRQRGFRDDIIQKFQLGYCLNQRDNFAKTAITKGFNTQYLEKTGLCYLTDDKRLLDRYWGRVIFPIHNLSGKVVAFGGRILNSDKKLAKYVNSPESEIYSKSHELYGIYFAKKAIVKHDRCYLVEGYTDVISMHQSGIENVVASSGTSLTSGQIRLIHRFTDNITVIYDGDAAGIKASLRGIDMILAEGMNIKVLLLPDGDDPDSFARKHNAKEYQEYIDKHQVDFIKFKANLLIEETKGDPIRRAELVQDIVRSIAVIPNRIVKNMYVKECSMMLDVKEELLVNEINKYQQQDKTETTEDKEKTEENQETAHSELADSNKISFVATQCIAEELQLIETIIRYGTYNLYETENEDGEKVLLSVAQFIGTDLENDELSFSNEVHQTILREACQLDGISASAYFMTHANPQISKLAAEMVEDKYALSATHSANFVPAEKRLHEIVPRLLYDFKSAIIRGKLASLLNQLKNQEIASNLDAYKKIMEEYRDLSKIEQQLSQVCGERVVRDL